MSDENTSILGSGWTFPPTFDSENRDALISSEEENIAQNLHALFYTEQGERSMRSSYGGNLQRFIFGSINTRLLNDIKDIVSKSIADYEPRIELLEVDIDENPDEQGLLLIKIDYRMRTTNTRHNMVFPFYLNEATFPDF